MNGQEVDRDEVVGIGDGDDDDGGGGRPSVQYLDCETVSIDGAFEEAVVSTSFNIADDIGTARAVFSRDELPERNGAKLLRLSNHGLDDGIDGAILYSVQLRTATGEERASASIGEAGVDVEQCTRRVAPDLTASVRSIDREGSRRFTVTFTYRNRESQAFFTRGELQGTVTTGSSPDRLRPGRNTFSVVWTPTSGNDRLTWVALQPGPWVGVDSPVVAQTPSVETVNRRLGPSR